MDKLDFDSLELNHNDPFVEMDRDFVLILPTYSDTITDIMSKFVEYKDNKKYLKGIIGGGEKNFGRDYIFSPKDLAKRHSVPLIFDFEKSGNDIDVEKFKKEVRNIGITKAE